MAWFNKRWITMKNYRASLQWKRLRKEAKFKYGFKCEHCGSKKLQVHHNIYPKDLKDDCVDNLVVCCPRCHGLHHSKRDNDLKQKKIDDYRKKITLFDYV